MSKHTTNGSSIVKQLKEVPGLLTCLMEHTVTKTTVQMKWEGPFIPEEEWHRMLAFFQWSYDTTHSETQVRLYVNKNAGTWKVWAFPQEARTGMAATELDTEKTKEQRARFNPSEGWMYFGTVHHHCSANAFQSSVDEANEKGQDGLHITVGDMDGNQYTLHERFYLCGSKINHELNWFWNIGPVMETVPEWASKLLPDNIKDRIARGQMCEKAPVGTTFPEEWKDNLICKAPQPVTYSASKACIVTYNGGLGYNPTNSARFQRVATNLTFDLAQAWEQLQEYCIASQIDEADMIAEMQSILKNDLALTSLISLMYRNDVSLERFESYCTEQFMKEYEANRKKSGNKDKGNRKNTGIPDYEGSDFGSSIP